MAAPGEQHGPRMMLDGCGLHRDRRRIELLFERGYGRPQLNAVIQTEHKFVVAPAVLPIDEGMRTKGQGDAGNAWLEAQPPGAGPWGKTHQRGSYAGGGAFCEAGVGPAGGGCAADGP